MTATQGTSPWTLTSATVAYRGRIRNTLLLAWDVSTPAEVTLILGAEKGAARQVWSVRRQTLADGLTAVAEDGRSRVWPHRGSDPDFTVVHPACGVEPFVVPEGALGRFLAHTAHWVPLGFEAPFEVAVVRIFKEAA